jgi:hypothetical protein
MTKNEMTVKARSPTIETMILESISVFMLKRGRLADFVVVTIAAMGRVLSC